MKKKLLEKSEMSRTTHRPHMHLRTIYVHVEHTDNSDYKTGVTYSHECPRPQDDVEITYDKNIRWQLYEPVGHTSIRIIFCPFCGVELDKIDGAALKAG